MGTALQVYETAFGDKRLPSRFNGNRFDTSMRWQAEKEYALQLIKKNEQLLKATPESIQTSMLEVAWSAMSLAPSLGHAYLIPYYSEHARAQECSFAPGYRGMAYVAQKGGACTGLTCARVMEQDKFRVFTDGNRRIVQHEENWDVINRGKLKAVYVIAHLASGESQVEVCSADIIAKAEAASRKKNPNGGFAWKGDFRDQMEIKVAIRRCLKLVPADGSGWLKRALETSDKHDGIDFSIPDDKAGDPEAQLLIVSDEQVLELHAALTTRGLTGEQADTWLLNLAHAYGLHRIHDLPARHYDEAKARMLARHEEVQRKRGGK